MIHPTQDARVLAALHAECFPQSPWSENVMRATIATPGTRAWLWNAGDGFLIVRSDGHSADILTLGTAPASRRQGVAANLLRAAADQLKAVGVARLVLEVSAQNIAAGALYESLGYRLLSLRKGYYFRATGAGDAHVMELVL